MIYKILGEEAAYKEAIENPNKNILVSSNLIAEMSERIGELESEIFKLKEILRKL